MTDVVKVTDAGHVRTIRLNRPERKNALSDELAWGVVAAVEEAASVDDVWVIAITGTGDAFCAGLDLSGGERSSPLSPQSAQLDDIHWVGQFLLAIRKRCDKPVVGGVNGVAVGAGLGLAMATDVRLVSRSARLMAGYTRIGGSPDAGLTITLPQAMGYERAMRFMMENRTVLGDEAVALGMAGEVVDDDAFDARLAAYCQQLFQWFRRSRLRLLKRGMVKEVSPKPPTSRRNFATRSEHPHRLLERGREEGAQSLFEKRKPLCPAADPLQPARSGIVKGCASRKAAAAARTRASL